MAQNESTSLSAHCPESRNNESTSESAFVMPNNTPPTKQSKSKSKSKSKDPGAQAAAAASTSTGKAAGKSVAKQGGKAAGKGVAKRAGKPAADGTSLGQRLLDGILVNIVTDLLKPEAGWTQLGHQVADLFDKLPFSGFVSLVEGATASGPTPTPADYNQSINALLVTLAGIQAHVSQLREITDRYGVSTEEIAPQVGRRLADTLASGQQPDYASVEKLVEAYSFYLYLQRTMPAAAVKEIRGKLKL